MKKAPDQTPEIPNFYLPFGGKLRADNRWMTLSQIIPWDLVEQSYGESLSQTGMGAPALAGRVAYGALVIKERLGTTDAETVEQIAENPYLQYFLGYTELLQNQPFDETMMVNFRSRFKEEHLRLINEEIIAKEVVKKPEGKNDDLPTHSGKLLVDASCTPADVKYPTDLGLLNEAREKTERIIDELHAEVLERTTGREQIPKKVRTYRREARKRYLSVAKSKKPGRKKIRKAIGQQLRYVRRNLKHIEKLSQKHEGLLLVLNNYWYKCLLVIHTLYGQQLEMYKQRKHSVADRIVSISQPHVRPIVRGKAGKNVEFGAKISISHSNGGFVRLDRLSWDAYNESSDLIPQIETYYARNGYYPESVHADQIYQTRENRRYCKEKGIRLPGKPLGRPKIETEANKEELTMEKAQRRQDELDRIPVEGKFGNAKRKGTLERIMAKLSHTSDSVIHIGITVLNLDKKLREVLFSLILRQTKRFLKYFIEPCHVLIEVNLLKSY